MDLFYKGMKCNLLIVSAAKNQVSLWCNGFNINTSLYGLWGTSKDKVIISHSSYKSVLLKSLPKLNRIGELNHLKYLHFKNK